MKALVQFAIWLGRNRLIFSAPHEPKKALRRAKEACVTTQLLGNEGGLVLDGRPNEQLDLTREAQWRDHLREVL